VTDGITPEDAASPEMKARVVAATEVVARTGASSVTLRFSDPDEDEDGGPTVWIAISTHRQGEREVCSVAAGLNPLAALYRLCDELVDGGMCAKCGRPTAFIQDESGGPMPRKIEGREVCWTSWDAPSEKFMRDCDRPRTNGGRGG
jgi:hypothetical protein